MANLVVNSVDDTKLPCYTLLLMQHHSFFRNLPPLFIYPYLPGTRYNYQNVLILKTNCTIFFLIKLHFLPECWNNQMQQSVHWNCGVQLSRWGELLHWHWINPCFVLLSLVFGLKYKESFSSCVLGTEKVWKYFMFITWMVNKLNHFGRSIDSSKWNYKHYWSKGHFLP